MFTETRTQLSEQAVKLFGLYGIEELCRQFQIKLSRCEQTDMYVVSGMHNSLILLQQHMLQLIKVRSDTHTFAASFASGPSLGSVPRMPPPLRMNPRMSTYPYASDIQCRSPVHERERGVAASVTGDQTSDPLSTSSFYWVDRMTFDVVELVADDRLKRLEEECNVSIRRYPAQLRNRSDLCLQVEGRSGDCKLPEGLDKLKQLCNAVREDVVRSRIQVPYAVFAVAKTVQWNDMKTILTREGNACVLAGLKEHVSAAEQTLKHLIYTIDSCSHKNELQNTLIAQTGQIIIVKKGNITQEQVDIIVNAANEQLKHTGGVAKAICQAAGGRKFQMECSELIRQHGVVKEGEALVTGPGLLHCKTVIHAVAPQWSKQASPEEKKQCLALLKNLCNKCLELADDGGGTSVAIPGIGSGHYGLPKVYCARALLAATHCFFGSRPMSCIRRVTFIDMNDQTLSAFQDEARRRYKSVPSIVETEATHVHDISTEETSV